MLYGILNLSLLGYIISTLVLVQITIAGVTIYLHRHQTHQALTLHPIVSHFFRFWMWLTTGMVTAEWVAVHRKHHAKADIEGDPHSPKVFGIKKVFWEGQELYRSAKQDREMVAKYSHGTPIDWIERNLYTKFSSWGIWLMFAIDLVLFGLPGITIWAVQMLWIPIHAAGVINGICHYWGYRNFECQDASTNIIPWGFWIGGEELHNNHHAYASSAKFSINWWEFDIGWLYIQCLAFLGLAKVKKLPPKLAVDQSKLNVDLDTVKAVISNRLQIMAQYYKHVIRPVIKKEKQSSLLNSDKHILQSAAKLLRLQESLLSPKSKDKLQNILADRQQLQTVYKFRQSLQNVWLQTVSTQKELVIALQQWCSQAEESGLEVLYAFAQQIKKFVPQPIR